MKIRRLKAMSSKSAALCVSVILACPSAAGAQSASQVVERYIKAIGGKQAVERITSTEVSGTLTSADGRSGVFTQQTRRPRLLLQSLSWGDARRRTGFNGRAAWRDDNPDEPRTLYGRPAARIRAEALYANTHLVAADEAIQFSITGREEVRGRAVIVVVALTAEGTKRTVSFDAASYLVVKDAQETEGGAEERFYDDYRPVNGVMEPHRIEWHRNGETLQIAVQRISHNTPIDAAVFDFLAAPAEPRLDADSVLSSARRNEERADSVLASYAYSVTTTSGRMDAQGVVTVMEGESYEMFHLGNRPVARRVKKRGGEPLSEAERKREDERINALVRDYERELKSGKVQPVLVRNTGANVIVRTPMLSPGWLPVHLRMSVFSNARREQLRGRRVIVLEFEPRRGAQARDDFERQAGVTAGALWIDEALQQMVRIETWFSDDHERVAEGTSIRVERILLNDEVWLPSHIELNFRQRFAFGNFSQWNNTIEYRDHKKFTVPTDSTIELPDAGR